MYFNLINKCNFVFCGLEGAGGCSWLSDKRYLSYDVKTGWKIRYFNVFQRFLRNFFGFYKTTHLDVVYSLLKVANLEMPSDLKKCFDKIEALWNIKYQDKSRSVGANAPKSGSSASLTDVVAESGSLLGGADIVGVGNASLSQAQIVFFAENDSDKDFHLQVGKWIDQHYKEGDVILFEENGSAITDSKMLESRYQIKSGCTYRRWCPEDLREPRGEPGQRDEPFAVSMESIASRLEKNVPKDSRWSDGLEVILREETAELLKRFKDLSEIYKLDAATTQKYLSLAASLVDFLKTQRAMYFLVSPGTVFKMLMMTKIFSVFEGKRADDAHHFVATSAPELMESIPSGISQNPSLIEVIKKNLKSEGKVFVILGISRILEMGPSFALCKSVQEAVQAHPYIILTRGKEYSKIANLNPQMRSQIH